MGSRMGPPPRVSEQLELALDDARLVIPWGGRSPRGLTRVSKNVILKALAAQSTSGSVVDERQLGLWSTRSKKVVAAVAATTPLLPLPWEVRDG